MATVQSPEVAEVGNTDFKPPVGGGSVFTRKATHTYICTSSCRCNSNDQCLQR